MQELKTDYNPWRRDNERELNVVVVEEKKTDSSFCVCRYRFPTPDFVFDHYTRHHVVQDDKVDRVEAAIKRIYDLDAYKTVNGVVLGTTPSKRRMVGYFDEKEFLRKHKILDRDDKVDKNFIENISDASVLNGIVDALLIILVHNDSISPKYLAHIAREVNFELDNVVNFTKGVGEKELIDKLRDAEMSIGNLCYNLWKSSNMKVVKTMASEETKMVLEELIIGYMRALAILSELTALTTTLDETASKAMLIKEGVIGGLSPRYIEASKRLFSKYADQSYLPSQDVHMLMDSADVFKSVLHVGDNLKYDTAEIRRAVNQTFDTISKQKPTHRLEKSQQKKKRSRNESDAVQMEAPVEKKAKQVLNTGAVHSDKRVIVQQALDSGDVEGGGGGNEKQTEEKIKDKFVQVSKKEMEQFEVNKEVLSAMFKKGLKESMEYLAKMKGMKEKLFDEEGSIGIIPVIPLPSIAAWEDRERATEFSQLDICNKRQLQYSSGELSLVTSVFVAFVYRFIEKKILAPKESSISVEKLIDVLKDDHAFCKSIVVALGCYFDINKSCNAALIRHLSDLIPKVVANVCNEVDGIAIEPASAVMMTALALFHQAAELMCSFSNELRHSSLVFGPGVRSMEQITFEETTEDAIKTSDFLAANVNTTLGDESKRTLADVFKEEAKECAILAKNYQKSFKTLATGKTDDDVVVQNVLAFDNVAVADEGVEADSVLFRLKKSEGYGDEEVSEDTTTVVPMDEDNFRLFREKMQNSKDKKPTMLIKRPLQVANEKGAIDINTSNRTWRDCKCVFCRRVIGNGSSGVVMTCGLSAQLMFSQNFTEFEKCVNDALVADCSLHLENAMTARNEGIDDMAISDKVSDSEVLDQQIIRMKHLLTELKDRDDTRLSYGNHAAHPACLYRKLLLYVVHGGKPLRCPKCLAIIANEKWRALGRKIFQKRYETLALMEPDEMQSLVNFKKVKWDKNFDYFVNISEEIKKCDPTQTMFIECHTSYNRVSGTVYEYINSVASVCTPLYMLLYKGKACSERRRGGPKSAFGFNRENWSKNLKGQTAAFMAFVSDYSAKLCDDQYIGLSGHLPTDEKAEDKATVIKNSFELLGAENDSDKITCSFTASDFSNPSKLKQVRTVRGEDGEETIPLTLLFQDLMKNVD